MEISKLNYNEPAHNSALVRMMDAFIREITGTDNGLADDLQGSLVPELVKRDTVTVLLAVIEGTPAGFAIGIEGFSTFACKPVLNIHDMYVDPAYRKQGAARMLMDGMEAVARQQGCIKLTLEVLEHNTKALKLYESSGYAPHTQNPTLGRALFYEKVL